MAAQRAASAVHAPDTTVRYVALLRGMNVGGHRVSMAALRTHVSALGLLRVETYIASGNVLFDAPGAQASAELERMIESKLKATLGYDVSTFVRTSAQLQSSLDRVPFDAEELEAEGTRVHIGFLKAPLSAAVAQRIRDASTSYDDLRVDAREMYWLTRGRFSDSLVKWPALERATKLEVTMRNLTTVQALAKKSA